MYIRGTTAAADRLSVTTPRYDPRTQPLSAGLPTDVGESQRDYVARVLCEAFAADRLTMEELDARLESAYRATTTQQLGQLLTDPQDAGRSLAQPHSPSRVAQDFAVPARGVGAAIMGGFERRGGWVLPRQFKAVAVMGGVELDLREARIAPGVTEIEVFTLMGGVVIHVPEGVRVEVVGMAIMGGFTAQSSAHSLDDADAPVLRVSGFALMAGVEVKRNSARDNQKRYEQALRRADKVAKKLR